MMNIEGKSVWQIRLATLGIFLLGFAVGAFALQSFQLWSAASKPQSKRERFEETFSRLGLTDAQKAEVQAVVSETREKLHRLRQEGEPRVQEIRSQHDEKLQRILTPEQWRQFQQEREEIIQNEKHNSPKKQMGL